MPLLVHIDVDNPIIVEMGYELKVTSAHRELLRIRGKQTGGDIIDTNTGRVHHLPCFAINPPELATRSKFYLADKTVEVVAVERIK